MRTVLPGAERVLAVHPGLLPQPDQLCGPLAAHLALHAVLEEPPSLEALAVAAGTRVWPHDEPAWRPDGAVLGRRGWDVVPRAATPQQSGTDAGPLALGVARACDVGVVLVPAPAVEGGVGARDSWAGLLRALVEEDLPVGVVANLRTGPVAWPGSSWDVGHFVVLVSYDPAGGEVGVADTYLESGGPGWPPGCRGVDVADLARALGQAPGRGLLLLAGPRHLARLGALVAGAGLVARTDGVAW